MLGRKTSTNSVDGSTETDELVVQAIPQLRDTYGRDKASLLIGLAKSASPDRTGFGGVLPEATGRERVERIVGDDHEDE